LKLFNQSEKENQYNTLVITKRTLEKRRIMLNAVTERTREVACFINKKISFMTNQQKEKEPHPEKNTVSHHQMRTVNSSGVVNCINLTSGALIMWS
jgi:hypothetical protein